MLLVGEGCRGRHAAADVSGEGGAGGEGVRALGRGLRQRMSQVRRGDQISAFEDGGKTLLQPRSVV